MRNLALLIRKDLISVFVNFRSFYLYMAVWLVVVAVGPSSAVFLYVMMIYLMVISLFSAEENDLVCNIAGVLPIRGSQVVIARYLYAYLVILSETVVAVVVCSVADALRDGGGAWVTPILLATVTSLLLISVNLPLIYRLGVMKTRMLSMILYIVMIAIASALPSLVNEFLPGLSGVGLSLLAVGAAIILSLLSLAVSVRIRR